MDDELTLYDVTRDELRRRLSDHFPADFDLEDTVTAYAYWVCNELRNHDREWESVLQEFVDFALRDAIQESQADAVEFDLLRRELARCASPLLDVGAGWGRFGSLYAAYGLEAVYAEPAELGCCLMRRNDLTKITRCLGQSLCFADNAFQTVVIGWVLHHDAPDVPSADILGEIARVMASGGRLISIEALSGDFDRQKWCSLVELAGFDVVKLERFFDLSLSEKKHKQYACLVAVSRAGHKHG